VFVVALWVVAAGLIVRLALMAPELHESWTGFQTFVGQAEASPEDPIVAYHPTLGWKHIPHKSTRIPLPIREDGVAVQINGQGFRAPEDYAAAVPPDRTRVIAIGDSFTFGHVDYADTWPMLVEGIEPTLQVVNMGAMGYGVDQMYLWYQEVGETIDADLVVLAIIQEDLNRARMYKWLTGHGRPFFELRDGQLELTNVPVPPRVGAGQPNLHPSDRLVGTSFRDFLKWRRGEAGEFVDDNYQDVPYVPFEIVRAFADLVRSQGRRFLVVYLPTIDVWEEPSDFREVFAAFCEQADIPLLDPTPAFTTAGGSSPDLFQSDRHYTPAGNAVLARAITPALVGS